MTEAVVEEKAVREANKSRTDRAEAIRKAGRIIFIRNVSLLCLSCRMSDSSFEVMQTLGKADILYKETNSAVEMKSA